MPRVPGEATHPKPSDSLGRAALPLVTRGGNNRRSSFTERISKDVWDLAGTDRKGSPGSSRGTRRGPEVGECARLGPASCSELCSCRRNAQSFAARRHRGALPCLADSCFPFKAPVFCPGALPGWHTLLGTCHPTSPLVTVHICSRGQPTPRGPGPCLIHEYISDI